VGGYVLPFVQVQNGDRFKVEENQKLVLALEDHGVAILHRCGGNARCTTCRVEILAGVATPMQAAEEEILLRKGFNPTHERLSCQIRVQGDLIVEPALTVDTAGMDAGPRPKD
jgi:ferredoxin